MFGMQERQMDTKEPPNKCNNHKTLYSSLQYNIPYPYHDKIVQWGKTNIPDDVLFIDETDPAYGREMQAHCTVLGGIHTSHFHSLFGLLLDEQSFSIELGKVSCFENCKFDVVKIDVIGGDLYRLNQELKQQLEVTETYAYHPHVTIAYVKPGTGRRFVGSTEFSGINLNVDVLRFFGCKNTCSCSIRLESNWYEPIARAA